MLTHRVCLKFTMKTVTLTGLTKTEGDSRVLDFKFYGIVCVIDIDWYLKKQTSIMKTSPSLQHISTEIVIAWLKYKYIKTFPCSFQH